MVSIYQDISDMQEEQSFKPLRSTVSIYHQAENCLVLVEYEKRLDKNK